MDILIDRLYRTGLQIGYEPQERRHEAPARTERSVYAYAGGDTAELSPLSIFFYNTAKDADGSYQNLSKALTISPFAQDSDDYGAQLKKITVLRNPAEKVYQQGSSLISKISQDTQVAISETLDITLEEAGALMHMGEIAKSAYLHSGPTGEEQNYRQMINVSA